MASSAGEFEFSVSFSMPPGSASFLRDQTPYPHQGFAVPTGNVRASGRRQAQATTALRTCLLLGLALGSGLTLSGCATLQTARPTPSGPLLVRANNDEYVWERSIDVLHEYLFEIERENKLDGVISTRYKTGAGLLEPWHGDSPDLTARWESTLQSIRRKAIVRITRAEGGFLIGVEAYKELEDVARPAGSPGAATFLDNSPLQRNLTPVVGQATPSGWVALGRDSALEASITQSLRTAFGNQ